MDQSNFSQHFMGIDDCRIHRIISEKVQISPSFRGAVLPSEQMACVALLTSPFRNKIV